MAEALVNGALIGGLFATVAFGLSIIFGVIGIPNLAHGELLMGGAYLSYVLVKWLGLDPLITIAIVAPVMFGVGYAVQRLVLSRLLKQSIEAVLVGTFGLSLLAQGIFAQAASANLKTLPASYATTGISLLGVRILTPYVIAFGVGIVLLVGLEAMLRGSRLGVSMRAVSRDPDTAATMGINVAHTYGVAVGIGSFLAAIGGVLIGISYTFSPTGGLTWLLIGFAVVATGGIGSVRGTWLGAIGIGLFQAAAGYALGSEWQDAMVYLAFLVVLVVRPTGLFGLRTGGL